MSELNNFGMRVDGEMYSALPEGHRTTYIVGLIDMLDWVSSYLLPERKAAADKLLRFARPIQSDDLRKIMDAYVNAMDARRRFATASSFVAALNEKLVGATHSAHGTEQ